MFVRAAEPAGKCVHTEGCNIGALFSFAIFLRNIEVNVSNNMGMIDKL